MKSKLTTTSLACTLGRHTSFMLVVPVLHSPTEDDDEKDERLWPETVDRDVGNSKKKKKKTKKTKKNQNITANHHHGIIMHLLLHLLIVFV